MKENSPQFEATYFRNHGIHSVPNGDSVDHLVSFPDWKETEIALKNDLPSSGTIITPEYITADEQEMRSLDTSAGIIRDRIDFVRDISRLTDAKFILGTPLKRRVHSVSSPSKDVWQNTALEIENGNTLHAHIKKELLPVEEALGITPSLEKTHAVRKGGRGVLICADLYAKAFNLSDDFIFKLAARDIIAPLMWSTPKDAISELVRDEKYYRSALEKTVSSYVLGVMPNVNRVTTVDKGTADIAPFNAVFTRK